MHFLISLGIYSILSGLFLDNMVLIWGLFYGVCWNIWGSIVFGCVTALGAHSISSPSSNWIPLCMFLDMFFYVLKSISLKFLLWFMICIVGVKVYVWFLGLWCSAMEVLAPWSNGGRRSWTFEGFSMSELYWVCGVLLLMN